MERSHSDRGEMEAVLARAIALVEAAQGQLEQHLVRMTCKEQVLPLLERAGHLRHLARQAKAIARLSEPPEAVVQPPPREVAWKRGRQR